MASPHRLKWMALMFVGAWALLACNFLTQTVNPAPAPSPTAPGDPQSVPALPLDGTAVAQPTAAVRPLSEGLVLEAVYGYRDRLDGWRVVGLLVNQTGRDVDAVEIEIRALDALHRVLYQDTVFTHLFNIPEGETSSFTLAIFDKIEGVDRFEAQVVGSSTAQIDRATVDVRKTSLRVDDAGDIHVTGELVNHGDRPVELRGLAAAVFDAEGQLITTERLDVAIRYLAPGEDGPFRVSAIGPLDGGRQPATFVVYRDVVYASPLDVLPVAIAEPVDFRDDSGDFHLAGEVANGGAQMLDIYLIAALYDAGGNVVDVTGGGLPIGVINAGETMPYGFHFWDVVNHSEEAYQAVVNYTIQVDRFWSSLEADPLIPLATEDNVHEFAEDKAKFTGMVVNASGDLVDGATVVIFLREKESGRVVGVGQDFLFDEMPAGERLPYLIYVDFPIGTHADAVDVFILVQGERP